MKNYLTLATILVFILLIIASEAPEPTTTNSSQPTHTRADNMDNQANKMLAYNYAIQFVEEKKGSNISFPGLMTKKDHIQSLGSGIFKINSYFDTNGSRIKFQCRIIFKNDKSIVCEGLTFN